MENRLKVERMNIARRDPGGKEIHTLPKSITKKWEPWLVLIVAFFYYLSYYRNGLNLGGEGGTVGVLALRLLEGQRPFVDTFLGYNVFWFYPIVGLFKVFGPNYLIVKVYFFAICTLTALLATLLTRRVTGSSLLAVGTGLLLVIIPGTQFRNYLPFLAILNMCTLFQVFIFSHTRQWRRWAWMGVAGLVLGLTYLIRIDVGILVTIVTLTLLLICPWSEKSGPLRGYAAALKGALTIGVFAFIVHIPVFWDAHRRGFQDALIGQYVMWFRYLEDKGREVFSKHQKKSPLSSLPPAPSTTVNSDSQALPQSAPEGTDAKVMKMGSDKQSTLSRPPLADLIQRKPVRRTFAWVIYLPIPIAIFIFIGMGGLWLIHACKRNFEECHQVLGPLLALGCAAILFPQYFFFRPDTPHVSEFMVPFLVAMVFACFQAVRIAKKSSGKTHVLAWGYAIALLCLCVPDTLAHVLNGLRRESSGSIAAIKNRGNEFVAYNGVRVLVGPEDFAELQGIYSTIVQNAQPGDWVVCYPYLPTINFMTNRRSYEFNLYVDNATKGKDFDEITINKLLHFRPAVVVISHQPINQNRASYFKIWAGRTYEFIKSHYQLAAVYDEKEIFVQKKPPAP